MTADDHGRHGPRDDDWARDPRRIASMLEMFGQVWRRDPEASFGNVASFLSGVTQMSHVSDHVLAHRMEERLAMAADADVDLRPEDPEPIATSNPHHSATWQQAVERLRDADQEVRTALYLSAGTDIGPLRPQVAAELSQIGATACNLFFFVDQAYEPWELVRQGPGEAPVVWAALAELPGSGTAQRGVPQHVQMLGLDACAVRLAQGGTPITVVFLGATNEHVCNHADRYGWAPDQLIAVCDGCGTSGANLACPNELFHPPVRRPPREWITDHLREGRAIVQPQTQGDVHGYREFPWILRPLGDVRSAWRADGTKQRPVVVFRVLS